MAVLRCPYCGERINKGSSFCSHCGKEIDKPVIDEVDTYFQESGVLLFKFFGVIILWFIIMLIVGFIWNVLNLPKYSATSFILSIILTIAVVIIIKIR